MHELVDLGHSMTHAAIGLCRDPTRTSEHIGISPAEEGWTVANDNEMYLVAALTCNVLQQPNVQKDLHTRLLIMPLDSDRFSLPEWSLPMIYRLPVICR
jgi:hypothetical protein